MIFLKRRALMTRFSFNYKTASGIGSLVLEKCSETFFKQFKLLGNSVQVTTKGVNLIPFPYVDKDMTKKGVTFTVKEDGGIKVYGTSSESVVFVLAIIDYGKESIFNNSTGNGKIISGGKDNVSIEYHGVTKKTYLSIEQGKAVNTIIYPQLQNGSVATPYEQYTGGKPSPSPEFPQEIKSVGEYNSDTGKYDVDVIVSRKNLLDISACDDGKVLDGNGDIVNNANALLTDFIPCFPNTQYCRSSRHFTVIAFYDVQKNKIGYINQFDASFFTPDKCRYFRFALNKKIVNYREAVVNIGNKLTDYEPYREPQNVKLSLDQPLRGIGEHKDEVTKDGVVRRIKQIVLNGSENWIKRGSGHEINTTHFYSVLKDAVSQVPVVDSKCDKFIDNKKVNSDEVSYTIYFKCFYMKLPKEQFQDVETLKSWLSKNPVTVEYALEYPITEPLPEETKIALESLYTNDGTTIITVDGGEVETGIEVEYAIKS